MSMGSLASTYLIASLIISLIAIISILIYIGTGKKEENIKTKGIVIIIILCLFLITISFIILDSMYISDRSDEGYLATFNLSVTTTKSINYTLYIPIPVISASHSSPENEGEPIDFIEEICSNVTAYKCSIVDINDTYYMKINSNIGIQIDKVKKMKSSEGNWFSKLSSRNINVDCNEDIELTIEYKVMIDHIEYRAHGFEFIGQVKNGNQIAVFEDIGYIND